MIEIKTRLITWRIVGIIMIVAGIGIAVIADFSWQPTRTSTWAGFSEPLRMDYVMCEMAELLFWFAMAVGLILSGLHILHAESLHKRRNEINKG